MYSNKIICDILEYIDINLNKKITIEELERHFFYNKYYLMKLFKKEIGISILEYINNLKINNSIEEIKNTNHSLTLISINNGFYSLEYFSEIFKKITKVNPRTFKNSIKNFQNINEKDLYNIRNTIINLQELIEKKDKYLQNKKTNITPVKKLSIFK